MSDSLKRSVINRLTFNSMFDPVCKRILELDEVKFDLLYGMAKVKHDDRAAEIRKSGFSMSKRGSDTSAINDMRNNLVLVDPEWCKEYMEKTVSKCTECLCKRCSHEPCEDCNTCDMEGYKPHYRCESFSEEQ